MNSIARAGTPRAVRLAAIALLAALPCRAQQTGRTYSIAGRVIDSLSQPVPGADLSIAPLHLAVKTDPAGRFRFTGVPVGAFVLQVRKLGFGPVDVAVLMPRDSSVPSITLVHGAVFLRTVVTQTVGLFDKPVRLAYTGKYDQFYQRRKYSTGSARFYTHEDIERMDVRDFIDILRRVPYLQLWESASGTRLRFLHCGMDGIMIELDGNRIWPVGNPVRDVGLSNPTPGMIANSKGDDTLSGPDPFELLRPLKENQIEAIEVYPSSSSLPVEAVGNACGAIFVWTR